VSEADLACMKAIDEIFTARPFYGSRRIRTDLEHDYKIDACRDRVRGMMRLMGLEAIYPKTKKTSVKNPNHKIYPYLLRHIGASFPNHIWGSDITYIRMAHGFCYLYAVIDWFSRLVVGWDLSPTMESDFCVETMDKAIKRFGVPEISNTDQGSQFTDEKFIGVLAGNNVKISMDGRGRCMDNIFTERLWRSVKYEEVYLKSYGDIAEAKMNLAAYFKFYNNERRHQSLECKTPSEVYANKKRLAPDTESHNKLSILTSPLLSTNTV
jgi:putative transposase